jgi:hypothetical protein
MFFVFMGVATGAALGVLWLRLVPELMGLKGLEADSLSGLGRVIMHPAFELPVLLVGVLLLSAGVATRTASGKDKATWILAAGSVWMFGMLMLSVNAVYDPVFLVEAAEDGAEDGAEAVVEPQ